MAYVEFLRVRHALIVYAAIVLTLAAAFVVSFDLTFAGRTGSDALRNVHVPLGLLLGIAGYASVAFATVLAASLNADRGGFAFTKPVSRARWAASYMLVDVAAILAAYTVALAGAVLLPLMTIGLIAHVYVDPHAAGIGLLGFGIALMWYGLLQAATVAYPGSGGRIVGLSWGAFFMLVTLPGATFLGPAFHAVVTALNVVNPVAYFSSLTSGANDSNSTRASYAVARSVFAWSTEARAATTLAIGLAACALAAALARRVEV